jgi:hypothetical protein
VLYSTRDVRLMLGRKATHLVVLDDQEEEVSPELGKMKWPGVSLG